MVRGVWKVSYYRERPQGVWSVFFDNDSRVCAVSGGALRKGDRILLDSGVTRKQARKVLGRIESPESLADDVLACSYDIVEQRIEITAYVHDDRVENYSICPRVARR